MHNNFFFNFKRLPLLHPQQAKPCKSTHCDPRTGCCGPQKTGRLLESGLLQRRNLEAIDPGYKMAGASPACTLGPPMAIAVSESRCWGEAICCASTTPLEPGLLGLGWSGALARPGPTLPPGSRVDRAPS